MNIMKKIFSIALAVFTLAACQTSWLDESKHPMPEGVGAKPEFQFEGESTINVSKLGGDYTATIKANQPWLVESTADWITVTSDRVGKGDGSAETVSFTVQKNPSLEPREGKIRMWITNDDEAYIVIKQDPLLLEDLGTSYYVTVNGTGDGSSWSSPTTLSKALAAAVDADEIYVAAGTYVPTDVLPGGEAGGDETFFVKANIKLIGGFPANPKEGDVADPVKNPVVISGEEMYYHCMVIGAPKSDLFSVEVSGLTLTKGNCFTTATQVSVNGGIVYKSYGGGLVVCGGRSLIKDCNIIANHSEKSVAGVFVTGGAETTFRNCSISENTGKGNGVGFWNGPNAVTSLYDCVIAKNSSTGVGAIYNYEITAGYGTPSLYMVNCEVSGNTNGSYGALYNRDGNAVLVNCTVHGNTAKTGAGVYCHGANGILTMISSTVTGNTATNDAGGLTLGSNAKVYVYNSVIAGNTAPAGKNADTGTITESTSSVLSGAASMFGAYNAGVYPLISGSGLTGGMTVAELQAVNTNTTVLPLIPEDVAVDAKGNQRTGTMMGAYIGK